MSIIIVFLIAGIIIGLYDKLPEKHLAQFKKIPFISLIFILFLMGAKIGMNPEILQNISTIGFKALTISLGSIIGSLVFIKLFLGKMDFSTKGQGESK